MKKRITITVIVLVVMVFFIIPLTKAIFKNAATTAGTLTAATWSVELNQTGLSDSVTLISGVDTQTYTLKVRNDSEVDIVYDIEISNVPSGVKIKIDQDVNYETPDANNKITFTDAGSIAYSVNGTENTHTLTFTSEVGTAVVSNRQLTVKVIAKQDI